MLRKECKHPLLYDYQPRVYYNILAGTGQGTARVIDTYKHLYMGEFGFWNFWPETNPGFAYIQRVPLPLRNLDNMDVPIECISTLKGNRFMVGGTFSGG